MNKQHLFTLTIPMHWDAIIKKRAIDEGETVRAYLRRLIREDVKRNGGDL